jgi:cell filamentation protein
VTDAWLTGADHFWPGTDVLQNKLGERDPVALRQYEYQFASWRQDEMELGLVTIPQTYDQAHLDGIHRHLFQDVYDWAGVHRVIPMGKDRKEFALPRDIERYLNVAADTVASVNWSTLDRREFAEGCAEVFTPMNFGHPYREGNGRAIKKFMGDVAKQSRFNLDFDRLANPAWRREWNRASAESWSAAQIHLCRCR